MRRLGLTAAVAVVLALASCGPAGKLLTGALSAAKPGIAANVQAGQTNTQSLQSSVSNQKLVRPQARRISQSADRNSGVRADSVSAVTVNQTPIWLIAVAFMAVFSLGLMIGRQLPSDREIKAWFK